MRAIVLGLALTLAVSLPAEGQQAIPADGTIPHAELHQVEAPASPMELDSSPAPIASVEMGQEEGDAVGEPAARNVLAIIGAVVVAVALFAFFS